MAQWDIQQLQAAWWGLGTVDPDPLFREAFPDVGTTVQKSPGMVVALGASPDRSARLQVSAGRCDLFVGQGYSERIQLLNFDSTLKSFRESIGTISRDFEASRIAVLVTTARVTSSFAEAAKLISEILDFHPPFDPDGDYVFAINHRQKSETEGVIFNRVMKWQAEEIQTILSAGGPPTVNVDYASTLQVDVNTVVTSGFKVSGQHMNLLFDEMFEEVERLSRAQRLGALQ